MKSSKHLDPLFIKEVMSFVRDIGYEAGEILMKFQKNRHELKIKDKGQQIGNCTSRSTFSDQL